MGEPWPLYRTMNVVRELLRNDDRALERINWNVIGEIHRTHGHDRKVGGPFFKEIVMEIRRARGQRCVCGYVHG